MQIPMMWRQLLKVNMVLWCGLQRGAAHESGSAGGGVLVTLLASSLSA